MNTSQTISICQHDNSILTKRRDSQSHKQGQSQGKTIKNCMACGSYITLDKVIKTQRFQTNFHSSNSKFLNSIRKRFFTPISQPIQLSKDTFSLLESLCAKFQFGSETLALGIYLYQLVESKAVERMEKDSLRERFISSACLIVAGKAIELDRKVPYLNRYQRYAESAKSKEEYQKQEQRICDILNFKLQYSTFLTLVNYLLSVGVVYQSDKVEHEQISLIEDDIIETAKECLKNGRFVGENQQRLALEIVKQVRIKYKLKQMPEILTNIFAESFNKYDSISCKTQDCQGNSFEEKVKSCKVSPTNNKDSSSNNVLQPLKTDRNISQNARELSFNEKASQYKYISFRNNPSKKENRQSSVKQNTIYTSGVTLGPKKISINQNTNMLASVKMNTKQMQGSSSYLKNKTLGGNAQQASGLSVYNPNSSIKYPTQSYKSQVNMLRHSSSSNNVNYERIVGYRLGSKRQ